MEKNKYIFYHDTLQRLIMGVIDSETDSIVRVKNPIIIATEMVTSPHPSDPTQMIARMNIQTIPVFMPGLRADREEPTICSVHKSTISVYDDFVPDAGLIARYNSITAPVQIMPDITGSSNQAPINTAPVKRQQAPNVIKLFDTP